MISAFQADFFPKSYYMTSNSSRKSFAFVRDTLSFISYEFVLRWPDSRAQNAPYYDASRVTCSLPRHVTTAETSKSSVPSKLISLPKFCFISSLSFIPFCFSTNTSWSQFVSSAFELAPNRRLEESFCNRTLYSDPVVYATVTYCRSFTNLFLLRHLYYITISLT